MSDGAPIYGCSICGAFVERLPGDRRCPSCHDGLVVEIPGERPAPQQARALFAWARRDATEVLEGRGMLVGVAAGAVVALILASQLNGLGLGKLLLAGHVMVLGALVGRLVALRVHRWLRPSSPLQPATNRRLRRRQVIAASCWAWLPVVLWLVASALGIEARQLVGAMWAAMATP